MTHTYKFSGMTCGGCQAKVQGLLSKVTGVKNISIDLAKGEATIDMDKHIDTNYLKEALQDYPKYQLSELVEQQQIVAPFTAQEETKSWIAIYKPILLIFWIFPWHYFISGIYERGICLDALDESFHGRILFGLFLF